MRCLICGAEITEGQLCADCVEVLKPHAEKMAAMWRKMPVELNGTKYGCISAIIIRARSISAYSLGRPFIVQAEVMSRARNCVMIADPKDVKIL